jgi:hypothetical protein
MTQRDRDRLVALKQAHKRQITRGSDNSCYGLDTRYSQMIYLTPSHISAGFEGRRWMFGTGLVAGPG